MKLKSYFLLSIMVGMAFACSSDEDIPEVEEVFTPDATLSLAAVADEKALTKAGEGTTTDPEETTDPEDVIRSLHVMVFNAGDNKLQNDTVVSSGTGSSINKVEDLQVQSGDVKILVMANAGTTEGRFKTLDEALAYQRSLDYEETTTNGFSMSSRLIEANLKKGMHNVFGVSGDFSDHIPAIELEGPILLTRHVAQINLVSVSIASTDESETKSDQEYPSFSIDSVFVANVKGYSKMASVGEWGAVESSEASEGGSLWWYGNCHEDSWNGKYKTTTNGLLRSDLLGFKAEKKVVTPSSSWMPATGERACGRSFYVYENMMDAASKPEYRTLLVLKGTYTNKNGRVEENRFYTIPVNDPDMEGSTSKESGEKPTHNYIKRNYRYNISLTIKSSGSDRPYDPASEACMDVAVKVADWNVVIQDENLD